MIETFTGLPETTIFLLDLDDFSKYNSVYSYENGNYILNKSVEIISQIPTLINCLKFGGDEFLFTCLGNFETSKNFIFSMLQSFESELKVTVSIGGVQNINKIKNSQHLIELLKTNVLLAKSNGKNQICIS
nr:diguanylate cyclase [Pontibacter sp. Tf4]